MSEIFLMFQVFLETLVSLFYFAKFNSEFCVTWKSVGCLIITEDVYLLEFSVAFQSVDWLILILIMQKFWDSTNQID